MAKQAAKQAAKRFDFDDRVFVTEGIYAGVVGVIDGGPEDVGRGMYCIMPAAPKSAAEVMIYVKAKHLRAATAEEIRRGQMEANMYSMEKLKKESLRRDPVFMAMNCSGSGAPAPVDGVMDVSGGLPMHRSYFENETGEQLIFLAGDAGVCLFHSDLDWKPKYISFSGNEKTYAQLAKVYAEEPRGFLVPDTAFGVILRESERMWLRACLMCASNMFDAKLVRSEEDAQEAQAARGREAIKLLDNRES